MALPTLLSRGVGVGSLLQNGRFSVVTRSLHSVTTERQDVPLAFPYHPSASVLSAPSTLHPSVLARRLYSPHTWSFIVSLLANSGPFPTVVDLGCACGLTAVELAKRGCRVTGVDEDVHNLAHARQRAQVEQVPLHLLSPHHTASSLHDGCADLVTMMHPRLMPGSPQLMHYLREAHRVLDDDRHLVACWNDRDLGHPFVASLEELLEQHVPGYERHHEQHDPEVWRSELESSMDGQLFLLDKFVIHANPVLIHGPVYSLMAMLASSDKLGGALAQGSPNHDLLQSKIQELVGRFCNAVDTSLRLPMNTKLYVMKKLR